MFDFVGIAANTAVKHLGGTGDFRDPLGDQPAGAAFRSGEMQMVVTKGSHYCGLQGTHIYAIYMVPQKIADFLD